jgi:hypothetical protein
VQFPRPSMPVPETNPQIEGPRPIQYAVVVQVGIGRARPLRRQTRRHAVVGENLGKLNRSVELAFPLSIIAKPKPSIPTAIGGGATRSSAPSAELSEVFASEAPSRIHARQIVASRTVHLVTDSALQMTRSRRPRYRPKRRKDRKVGRCQRFRRIVNICLRYKGVMLLSRGTELFISGDSHNLRGDILNRKHKINTPAYYCAHWHI